MLSALILIPILGAIIIGLLPQQGANLNRFRVGAITAIAISFGWTVVIITQFDITNPTLQLTESIPWIDSIGLRYQLGVDGLSLPLLALNSLLAWIAIYSSDKSVNRPRLYYILLLVLNAGVVGAFLADNLLLFFLFYELELIPLYLLIAIWGGEKRGYAATKFLIYTAISGILILAAFLGLTWLGGATNFDYQPLLAKTLPIGQQLILLGAILIGFGIKIPLVPLHTWLPDAHVEASTPVSVLLAGVLLKLGTYGILRFGLGLFPEAWIVLAPIMANWAVVSVLYGAFTAIAQTDMKKMVAYSSIAHMGYVLLAASTATPLSLLAAVFQMVSHGLISALLFLLVGVVYQKTGTRNLDTLRGLLNPERGLPLIGSLMVLGVMASSGIPGMVGFISEFMVFRSSFAVFPTQTLLCMIGTGLTAVYFLLLVNRVFFGRLSTQVVNLPPVGWFDRTPSMILAVAIVIFGLQPAWMLRWSETTLLQRFGTESSVPKLSATATFMPIPAAIVSQDTVLNESRQ